MMSNNLENTGAAKEPKIRNPKRAWEGAVRRNSAGEHGDGELPQDQMGTTAGTCLRSVIAGIDA
eukprot:782989-Rhodomonas_salina.1